MVMHNGQTTLYKCGQSGDEPGLGFKWVCMGVEASLIFDLETAHSRSYHGKNSFDKEGRLLEGKK